MASTHEAVKAFYEAFCQYLEDRENEDLDFLAEDQYDENGRPKYLMCDEIWEILDDAGHGTPLIIHHNGRASEVLIYDRYASQTDNVRFMDHIYEEIENGCLVTINGTDIFDLY